MFNLVASLLSSTSFFFTLFLILKLMNINLGPFTILAILAGLEKSRMRYIYSCIALIAYFYAATSFEDLLHTSDIMVYVLTTALIIGKEVKEIAISWIVPAAIAPTWLMISVYNVVTQNFIFIIPITLYLIWILIYSIFVLSPTNNVALIIKKGGR